MPSIHKVCYITGAQGILLWTQCILPSWDQREHTHSLPSRGVYLLHQGLHGGRRGGGGGSYSVISSSGSSVALFQEKLSRNIMNTFHIFFPWQRASERITNYDVRRKLRNPSCHHWRFKKSRKPRLRDAARLAWNHTGSSCERQGWNPQLPISKRIFGFNPSL